MYSKKNEATTLSFFSCIDCLLVCKTLFWKNRPWFCTIRKTQFQIYILCKLFWTHWNECFWNVSFMLLLEPIHGKIYNHLPKSTHKGPWIFHWTRQTRLFLHSFSFSTPKNFRVNRNFLLVLFLSCFWEKQHKVVVNSTQRTLFV